MARLILDTGILVAASQGRFDLAEVGLVDDVAVPAIVVAEFGEGVLRIAAEARRRSMRAFLDDVVGTMPTVDYTLDVAEVHAELLAHTRRAGRPRGAHDLIIAACARSTDRVVLTRDARARFAELPGVEARVLAS